MRIVQKVPSLYQVLDLSNIFHIFMNPTGTEIYTEIWISFSGFIWIGSELLQ